MIFKIRSYLEGVLVFIHSTLGVLFKGLEAGRCLHALKILLLSPPVSSHQSGTLWLHSREPKGASNQWRDALLICNKAADAGQPPGYITDSCVLAPVAFKHA